MKKEVREFLEGKPSLEGEKIWNRWFQLPRLHDSEAEIFSSPFTLQNEIKTIKNKSFRLLGLNHFQWRIAASVVLMLGVGSWFYSLDRIDSMLLSFTYEKKITKNGESSIVNLSDGSQIYLNAGSVLKYPKKFDGATREVYLEGEAFFEIAKDKKHPFIIHTDKMDTKVVGTSFNIQAYPDHKNEEVSVVTGKVSVSAVATKQQLFISPGQKAALNKKSNAIKSYSKIDISSISTWRTNTLVFDNAPINEVVSTIERNYDVKVELDDSKLKNLNINAGFEKLSAEQVITLLCNTIDASFTKESGVYIIKCNELNKTETK